MAEFRCISCGEVKASSKPCTCPVCGYRMFETPYDRASLLKEEIRRFVSQLRLTEMPDGLLTFFREEAVLGKSGKKEKITRAQDDARFPDYAKILGYICAAARTEVFCERLNESIRQIAQHIRTPWHQQYQADLSAMRERIGDLDETLLEALKALGLDVAPAALLLPAIMLEEWQEPDPLLLPVAEEVLEACLSLVQKIHRFIRQNNIYGSVCRERPQRQFTTAKRPDYLSELISRLERINAILEKRYIVDLLSDGHEELMEMLGALWSGLEAVMLSPVLARRRTCTLDDGTVLAYDEMKQELLRRLALRCSGVDAALASPAFGEGMSEDELFACYDQMISLDEEGFLGMNRATLLKIGESEKKLNALIGLGGIKESLKKIKAYAMMNRDSGQLSLHMCFLGNPGSGKTEVARLVANILYENKILPTNRFVEVDRAGLVSQYFGATAEKTTQVIRSAMGGVLFIDEAYALGNNSDSGLADYGKEALDTLVKAMEDHRGKFCVILAGYRNEMQQMMSVNPGFRSRIQFTLDFPNYSRDELRAIALMMLDKRGYTIGEGALSRILDITDIRRKDANFANAREIRNILDQVIMCQNLRCAGTSDTELGLVDVNRYIQEMKIKLPTGAPGAADAVPTGEEELEQLIGLESVKRMVRKIRAYARRNQGQADFNLHMCFYGNPGTGKTEVARILSRILYDASVLEEAKLVETDAHGLIGKYIGETAPKTQQKINDAMGGVLFIDEAYALCGGPSATGGSASYGEEAISVLLKEMEDRRGQFCVILAGYRAEMKEMLNANPGMESRIQFTLEFPDYTREELGQIARSFLRRKRYTIADDALERFLDVQEYYRNQPNFANARTVRNVLDQVIMNQNLRTEDEPGDDRILLSDVEDYLLDEGIDLSRPASAARRIGFS